MDNEPSTSKPIKDVPIQQPAEVLPPELDIASDEFDPMRALYANPEVKLTKRKSKIIFQNMAAFEIEYNKKGLYGLSLKSKNDELLKKNIPHKAGEPSTSITARRFLPHQMAIQTTGATAKNKRNLEKQIENMQGPLAILRDCMLDKRQIKIYTRSEHGIRGTITGYLISFDKHWNLLLRDVHETWKRRKYKYDENKLHGTPSDCSERLKELGITVPETTVKSLNRKTVELSRSVSQLLIRGEQIVLAITGKGVGKTGDVRRCT